MNVLLRLQSLFSMLVNKMDKRKSRHSQGGPQRGGLHGRSMSVSSYIATTTPQHRTFLTICMYGCFLALGLVGSVMGPTIVHMQHLLDTDLQGMTLTFTYHRIGYLIGVVISGCLFDRLNQELQFAIACLIEGIATAAAPWMPGLYGYYGAMVLQALAHGYINTGGQSFIIGLWEGHRFKRPVIQGGNALWSLGASICPFIASPFLVSLPVEQDFTTAAVSTMLPDTNLTLNILTNSPLNLTDKTTVQTFANLGNVRYAYFIVGLGMAVISVMFFIAFFISGSNCDNNGVTVTQERPKLHGDTYCFKLPMLMLLYLFFVFYVWYEGVTGGLLSAFVIQGLHWPVHKGPLITSVYWGAHGVGRLLGIPISLCLNSAAMLICNLTFTTAAFIIMYFAPGADTDVYMWLSVAMAGFAMATTYTSMMLWVSNHMTITGAAGSVFLMGTSTGGMTGAPLVGHLFQTYTHMWMIYLSLCSCGAHILLFFLMFSFAHFHKKKSRRKSSVPAIKKNGFLPHPRYVHRELDSEETSDTLSSDIQNSQQSCNGIGCVNKSPPCQCLDFQLRSANSNVV